MLFFIYFEGFHQDCFVILAVSMPEYLNRLRSGFISTVLTIKNIEADPFNLNRQAFGGDILIRLETPVHTMESHPYYSYLGPISKRILRRIVDVILRLSI